MAGGSIRLRLRVQPGARDAAVVGRQGEAWKLRVTAPPERGRANDAAVRLLAETLRVAPESVTLVAGHRSRDKVVEITGLDQAEAERRLAG